MVLKPAELAVSRSLRKTLRRGDLEVRLDTAFHRVVDRCAVVPRRGEAGTWITRDMAQAYARLHELGFAHSAETWQGGELVGGLYGVSLGSAFFGESMFADRPDASKIAFAVLVRQLTAWGFDLIDCQVHTEHLARFGAREGTRRRFLTALRRSLATATRSGAWKLEERGPDEPGW
jgi:leucyl/phenylalanyl-tRNA--protein transferase